MDSGKSGKKETSLLLVNEIKLVDNFGGVGGSLLDGDGRVVEASLSGFVAEDLRLLGMVVVLMSDGKLNAVSGSLLGRRSNLLAVETVVGGACGLVVESSQVHDGGVEALFS